jgi:hypothetical protein
MVPFGPREYSVRSHTVEPPSRETGEKAVGAGRAGCLAVAVAPVPVTCACTPAKVEPSNAMTMIGFFINAFLFGLSIAWSFYRCNTDANGKSFKNPARSE